jgi:hypothetical protein
VSSKNGISQERSLWGPHPDHAIAAIEDEYYQLGFTFLVRLFGAVLGVSTPRKLQKALGGAPESRPIGWGTLADQFKADGDPERLVANWQAIVDRLIEQLLPAKTKEEAARRMSVQAHLHGRIRAQVEAAPSERMQGGFMPRQERIAEEALQWTRLHALEGVNDLEDEARRSVVRTLMQCRESGEGTRVLQQRLFDQFSEQNRDWRRLALTETAAAVAHGSLSAVNPEEGWEAEWVAAPTACSQCSRWNGRRFRVVDASKPNKDGDTEVWPGKTNQGRSASPRTREGRRREKHEQWWPTQPCHPCCSCQWVMHRVG